MVMVSSRLDGVFLEQRVLPADTGDRSMASAPYPHVLLGPHIGRPARTHRSVLFRGQAARRQRPSP